MEMEKERDKKYYKELNKWRWKFLSLSRLYKETYNICLQDNNLFEELAFKCYVYFDLVLLENYYKEKKLPDPTKGIEKQIGHLYFNDYYYHLTEKSLLMKKVFGEDKPCLNISKFLRNGKIITSLAEHGEIGGYAVKDNNGRLKYAYDTERIMPTLATFVLDASLPIQDAVKCFESEYSALKKKQTQDFRNWQVISGRVPEKKKNQRLKDWENFYNACLIYERTRDEFEKIMVENVDTPQQIHSEIVTRAQSNFKKNHNAKLRSLYNKKQVTASFDRWCNRTFNEWRRKGNELARMASAGIFVLPD